MPRKKQPDRWVLTMYSNGALFCVEADKAKGAHKYAVPLVAVRSREEGERVIARFCTRDFTTAADGPMCLPFPLKDAKALPHAVAFLSDAITRIREHEGALAIAIRFVEYRKLVGLFVPGRDLDVDGLKALAAEKGENALDPTYKDPKLISLGGFVAVANGKAGSWNAAADELRQREPVRQAAGLEGRP